MCCATVRHKAGSSKSDIIEARIWLKDIGTSFAPMNEVWNAWVDPNSKGVRTCVEANLVSPHPNRYYYYYFCVTWICVQIVSLLLPLFSNDKADE